jgi:RNA polymerase sigma-70 factor (ECF subfamily)
LLLTKPDAVLVALARDGDDAAMSAIVDRYSRSLHRHCRTLLPHHQAEDAVQQTFVRALQALRSGVEVRELRPWLHRIARNVALTELASRGSRHEELNDEWEDCSRSGEVDRRADFRAALTAIASLPDRQRTAMVRSAGGDSHAAIAQQMGISEAAARSVARAR